MGNYKRAFSGFIRVIIVLVAIAAILAAWLYYENIGVTASNYTIYSAKLPAVFEDYKIALLSDFHNSDNYEKIYKHIEEQKPDIIVLAGDMISRSDENPEDWYNLSKLLDLLSGYPMYYSSGNHEKFLPRYDEYIQFLREKGVVPLESEAVEIEYRGSKINLIGYKDIAYSDDVMRHDELREELRALQKKIKDPNLFNILICHRATLFDTVSEFPFDLVLSGHTHGGQVGIPGLNRLVLKIKYGVDKYVKGYYRNGDSQMIVSGGLSKIPTEPRFFNNPEVVFVTLRTTQ